MNGKPKRATSAIMVWDHVSTPVAFDACGRSSLLGLLRYALSEAGFPKSAAKLGDVENAELAVKIKAIKRARRGVLSRLANDRTMPCVSRGEKKALRRIASALRLGIRAIRSLHGACRKLSRALLP